MDYEHTTLASARDTLERMIEDAKSDGFDADNDIDVVYSLMLNLQYDCSPAVSKELWRVELGIAWTVPPGTAAQRFVESFGKDLTIDEVTAF